MQTQFQDHKFNIRIDVEPARVWAALTTAKALEQWMLEEKLEVTVGNAPGDDFTVKGHLHGLPFENRGKVIEMETNRTFSYSHLSSLSDLPDVMDSYSLVNFSIVPYDGFTELQVRIRNFPSESIYKHLVFYWNSSLGVLKKFVEKS